MHAILCPGKPHCLFIKVMINSISNTERGTFKFVVWVADVPIISHQYINLDT